MAGLESSAAVAPLSTPVEPAPSWIPSLAHGTAVRPARNQQKASLFPISPAGEAIGDPTLSHADVSSQGPRELRSNENEQHGSDMTPRRGRSLHYRWQKIHLREASPVGRSCDDREKQEEAPESDVGSGEAGESSLCPTKGSGRHEQAPHSRPSASCIATWDVEGGHESGLTLDTTGRPADEGGTSKEPGMGGTNAYEDKAPRDEGGDGKAGKKQTRGRSAVRRLNEKSNRSRASSPDPRGISEESSARKNTTSSSPGLEAGLLSSVRFSSTHQGHQAGMPQPEEFPKSSIPMKKGHSFFGGVGDGGVLRAARSSGKRRGLLFSSLTRSTTAPGRSAADLPSFSRSSSRWHKRLNRPRGDATALQAGRSFRRVSSSSAVDSDQGRSILSRVESVGWVRKLTQARRGTDDPHRGGQGVSSWWRDAVAGDGNRTQVTGKKIPRTSFNQSTQATKWVAWEGADADDRYEEAVAEAERLRRVMVQDIRRPPCPVFSVDYKRQQKGKRLVSARKFESSKIKEVRGRKMYGPPSKRVALAKRRGTRSLPAVTFPDRNVSLDSSTPDETTAYDYEDSSSTDEEEPTPGGPTPECSPVASPGSAVQGLHKVPPGVGKAAGEKSRTPVEDGEESDNVKKKESPSEAGPCSSRERCSSADEAKKEGVHSEKENEAKADNGESAALTDGNEEWQPVEEVMTTLASDAPHKGHTKKLQFLEELQAEGGRKLKRTEGRHVGPRVALPDILAASCGYDRKPARQAASGHLHTGASEDGAVEVSPSISRQQKAQSTVTLPCRDWSDERSVQTPSRRLLPTFSTPAEHPSSGKTDSDKPRVHTPFLSVSSLAGTPRMRSRRGISWSYGSSRGRLSRSIMKHQRDAERKKQKVWSPQQEQLREERRERRKNRRADRVPPVAFECPIAQQLSEALLLARVNMLLQQEQLSQMTPEDTRYLVDRYAALQEDRSAVADVVASEVPSRTALREVTERDQMQKEDVDAGLVPGHLFPRTREFVGMVQAVTRTAPWLSEQEIEERVLQLLKTEEETLREDEEEEGKQEVSGESRERILREELLAKRNDHEIVLLTEWLENSSEINEDQDDPPEVLTVLRPRHRNLLKKVGKAVTRALQETGRLLWGPLHLSSGDALSSLLVSSASVDTHCDEDIASLPSVTSGEAGERDNNYGNASGSPCLSGLRAPGPTGGPCPTDGDSRALGRRGGRGVEERAFYDRLIHAHTREMKSRKLVKREALRREKKRAAADERQEYRKLLRLYDSVYRNNEQWDEEEKAEEDRRLAARRARRAAKRQRRNLRKMEQRWMEAEDFPSVLHGSTREDGDTSKADAPGDSSSLIHSDAADPVVQMGAAGNPEGLPEEDLQDGLALSEMPAEQDGERPTEEGCGGSTEEGPSDIAMELRRRERWVYDRDSDSGEDIDRAAKAEVRALLKEQRAFLRKQSEKARALLFKEFSDPRQDEAKQDYQLEAKEKKGGALMKDAETGKGLKGPTAAMDESPLADLGEFLSREEATAKPPQGVGRTEKDKDRGAVRREEEAQRRQRHLFYKVSDQVKPLVLLQDTNFWFCLRNMAQEPLKKKPTLVGIIKRSLGFSTTCKRESEEQRQEKDRAAAAAVLAQSGISFPKAARLLPERFFYIGRPAAEIIAIASSGTIRRKTTFNCHRLLNLLNCKSVIYYLVDVNTDATSCRSADTRLLRRWKRQKILRSAPHTHHRGVLTPQLLVDGQSLGPYEEVQLLEDDGLLDSIFARGRCPTCLRVRSETDQRCGACGFQFRELLSVRRQDEGQLKEIYRGRLTSEIPLVRPQFDPAAAWYIYPQYCSLCGATRRANQPWCPKCHMTVRDIALARCLGIGIYRMSSCPCCGKDVGTIPQLLEPIPPQPDPMYNRPPLSSYKTSDAVPVCGHCNQLLTYIGHVGGEAGRAALRG